jgi:hypothetical protein
MSLREHRSQDLCATQAFKPVFQSRDAFLFLQGHALLRPEHFGRGQRGALHLNGTQAQLTIRRTARSGNK